MLILRTGLADDVSGSTELCDSRGPVLRPDHPQEQSGVSHVMLRHWLYKEYENHDLAIARSSSSRADPGLRVAFKCLNI